MEIFFAGLISLITLIVFFVMAANVGKIARRLTDDRKMAYRIDYYRNRSLGNLEQARDAILNIIFFEVVQVPEEGRKNTFIKMKKHYNQVFIEMGFEFPENPFP